MSCCFPSPSRFSSNNSLQSLSSELIYVTPNQTLKLSLGDFAPRKFAEPNSFSNRSTKTIKDTGSFEIVVRSSRCKHCVHPTTPYDHKLSKTYQVRLGVVLLSFLLERWLLWNGWGFENREGRANIYKYIHNTSQYIFFKWCYVIILFFPRGWGCKCTLTHTHT